MLTEDENNNLGGDESLPTRKSGQRKAKAEQEGKKAEPRRRKSAQRQDPLPDQLPEAAETITADVAPTATADVAPTATTELAPTATAEITPTALPPIEISAAAEAPVVPAVSTDAGTVDYQTIANAYRDYARESLDQTKSYFEKLAGVRSLDKAFELQTEFAKQAFAGFVAESQKIRELHSQMARQRLKHWEGLFARMISPR